MSVAFVEKPERQGDSDAKSGSGKWEYVARVIGEANPETALLAAIAADAGFFWYNLSRKKIGFQQLGGYLYSASVEWTYEVPDGAAQDPTQSPGPTGGPGGGAPSGTPSGPATADTPLGPNISLEIGGRPPKLFLSRSVVFSELAGGGPPPDNGKLINVNRQTGEVEGVEIEDPASVLTIEITVDYVTMRYIDLLQSKVWHRNNATWYHMALASVAFMGCSLQSDASGRVKASFRFGLRPRETIAANSLRDETSNDLPTSDTDKRGWDYLEVAYEDVLDAATGLKAKKPLGMYIHDVLPEFDFAGFGIGGA